MDDRTYRPADRVAYAGMAGYSLMQGAWVLAAFSGTGFGIFESGMLVGIVLPVFGLAALFGYQGCSREKRFSAVVERSGSGGGVHRRLEPSRERSQMIAMPIPNANGAPIKQAVRNERPKRLLAAAMQSAARVMKKTVTTTDPVSILNSPVDY